jgi:hypothetical protein
MANKKQIIVENKNGKKVRLLTPDQKGAKAAVELKKGIKLTNFGKVKRDKGGNPLKLNKAERSYRAGYLDARTDNAKAYKHNKKKRAARRAAKKSKK